MKCLFIALLGITLLAFLSTQAEAKTFRVTTTGGSVYSNDYDDTDGFDYKAITGFEVVFTVPDAPTLLSSRIHQDGSMTFLGGLTLDSVILTFGSGPDVTFATNRDARVRLWDRASYGCGHDKVEIEALGGGGATPVIGFDAMCPKGDAAYDNMFVRGTPNPNTLLPGFLPLFDDDAAGDILYNYRSIYIYGDGGDEGYDGYAEAEITSFSQIADCDPDVTAPVLVGVPADVTLECENGVPPPMASGIPTPLVTATDECDENPSVAFEVHFSDGGPSTIIIERTWTATDASNNSSSATQTVTVYDNTPPEVHCNASNITEIDDEDEEVSFTATSTDACSGVTTQVGWLVCIEPTPDEADVPWWYEYEPCQVTTIYGDDDDDDDDEEGVVVEVDGATVTIIKSGEIGTVIGWTALGTDDCGNTTTVDCSVTVIEEEVVEEDEIAEGDDDEEELPWWGYDPTAPTDDDDDADDADDADAADDTADTGDDELPWWGEDPTAEGDDDDSDADDDSGAASDDDDAAEAEADDDEEEELPWWW